MTALISLALAQAVVSGAVPVVHDAPPAMLLAGYNQCLNQRIDERIAEPIQAEEIFDRSHAACSFWLDAYIAKIQATAVPTNVDFKAAMARQVADWKGKVVARIEERRASLADQKDKNLAPNH